MCVCKYVYKNNFPNYSQRHECHLIYSFGDSLQSFECVFVQAVLILYKPLHLLGVLHALLGFEGIKDFISSIKGLKNEMLLEKEGQTFLIFLCFIKRVKNVFIFLVENMLNRFTVSKPLSQNQQSKLTRKCQLFYTLCRFMSC